MSQHDESMIPDEPSSLSGWVVAVLRAISAAGSDPQPMMEEAGINPLVLTDPEARVTVKKMTTLWRLAIAETGDEALGLRASFHLANSSLYALDTLVDAAPNLEQGWQYLLNFYQVLSNGIHMSLLAVSEDDFEIHIQTLAGEAPEGVDGCIACIVKGLLGSMRDKIAVSWIEMSRKEPTDPAEFERILGCDVRFSQPITRIRFRSLVPINEPSMHANPQLESALQAVLSDYLQRMDKAQLVAQTRREIMTQMTHGEPTLELVADKLSMSGRTLQRKLVAEGSGYRPLVDEVRQTIAKQLVATTELSFTDIAFRLGFRDASNFSRVFRRWMGVSPSEYRQQV
jgi:AraC-like DNA-binding protein